MLCHVAGERNIISICSAWHCGGCENIKHAARRLISSKARRLAGMAARNKRQRRSASAALRQHGIS